jgi:hypothetical protein
METDIQGEVDPVVAVKSADQLEHREGAIQSPLLMIDARVRETGDCHITCSRILNTLEVKSL